MQGSGSPARRGGDSRGAMRGRDGLARRGGSSGGCDLWAAGGCRGGLARRAGAWWKYGGGGPLVEGVDFVPDSVEGGGSEWFFSPDSDDEVNSERQLLQVEDSEFVPDSLVEEPGGMKEGWEVDLGAQPGATEVGGVEAVPMVDGGRLDLGWGTKVYDLHEAPMYLCGTEVLGSEQRCNPMADVLGSEYIVDEDIETQEQWVTDMLIQITPCYASYVYRKKKQ